MTVSFIVLDLQLTHMLRISMVIKWVPKKQNDVQTTWLTLPHVWHTCGPFLCQIHVWANTCYTRVSKHVLYTCEHTRVTHMLNTCYTRVRFSHVLHTCEHTRVTHVWGFTRVTHVWYTCYTRVCSHVLHTCAVFLSNTRVSSHVLHTCGKVDSGAIYTCDKSLP